MHLKYQIMGVWIFIGVWISEGSLYGKPTVEVALLEVMEVGAEEILNPVSPKLPEVLHALDSTVQSVQIQLTHHLEGEDEIKGWPDYFSDKVP